MSGSALKWTAWALTLLAVGGAGFATTGSQGATDRFRIEGCSLGCAAGPVTVSCGVVNVFVNEEFKFDFTQAVDLPSVLAFPASFRILETATALTPPGVFRLEGRDRRTLVFDPQLSFDPLGNPIFGLDAGASYVLFAPGILAGDPPPYVLSYNGLPLENRLLCTVIADRGVRDYVPGAPTYAPRVQVVETCAPGGPTHGAPAANARCVWVDSNLTLVFHDLMNLGTLMIPASGNAPFLQVRFANTGLQVLGSWSYSIDTLAKTTTVVFDPAATLPRASRIDVLVPPQVIDLVGNPHSGPTQFSFMTAGAQPR